jgi:prenyltransferase beta subunit
VALSGLQDLDEFVPSGGLAAGLGACVGSLARPCGGFANESELPFAMTPSTAAAIVVLKQIGLADGAGSVAAAADWLLARIGSDGGFAVFDGGPSDLLSTATALHALSVVKMRRETGTDTGAVVVPGVCPRFPEKVGAETRTDTDNINNVGVSPRFSCRDYVQSLRTPNGGFCGGICDRVSDCEYTFYGLLAMGHLRSE